MAIVNPDLPDPYRPDGLTKIQDSDRRSVVGDPQARDDALFGSKITAGTLLSGIFQVTIWASLLLMKLSLLLLEGLWQMLSARRK